MIKVVLADDHKIIRDGLRAMLSYEENIDIVAEKTPFEGTPDAQRWKACHQQFVAASQNREGILAQGSGHYIHREKPDIVFNAIVKLYHKFCIQ